MCLAIPGKIIGIASPEDTLTYATVDFGGIHKEICIAWIDARVGDYVLAHAGMALTVIDEEEARLTREALIAVGDLMEVENE
ncbi:MAG: HypC/HybG/HupF family hydrogenase formation chaperone [Bacteroidales bacterium]